MNPSELLSEEEKLRIKLEELYRNEVKQSLENNSEKKSPKAEFWNFLNSTFGIWFLSTCVVGLITFVYTKQQEKNREEAERKQIEIEHARRNASLVTVLLPYLASQEEKQWRLAIEVTKYLKVKGELPGELESALEGIVIANNSDTTTASSPIQQAKVNAAAAVIDIENNPKQENGTVLPYLPPRVYIQISAENQRPVAKSLQAAIRKENFIAPGIENVGKKANIQIPNETEVRYYRDEEKTEAVKLVSILKSLNLDLKINDTPKKIPGQGAGTRPRHYEIWFSKS